MAAPASFAREAAGMHAALVGGDFAGLLEGARAAATGRPPLEAMAATAYAVLALVHMRRFDEARAELGRVGDVAARGEEDDTVPFVLRRLHAEMPRHFGQAAAAAARCDALAAMCGRRAAAARQRAHRGDDDAVADAQAEAALWERRHIDVLATGAALRFASGDAVGGAQAVCAARDVRPTDPRAWLQVGYAQLVCGADEAAGASIARAVQCAGDSPPPGLAAALALAQGNACLVGGDVAGARRRLEGARASYPSDGAISAAADLAAGTKTPSS